jgi:hypothetical protein
LNRFDGKGLKKKAVRAGKIFNAMKIKTVDDILLEIVVKKRYLIFQLQMPQKTLKWRSGEKARMRHLGILRGGDVLWVR